MPRITVGTAPVLIYSSKHGSESRPTFVTFRIDPEDETSVIYTGRDSNITPGGTPATDGLPLLAGEPRTTTAMQVGDEIWAVADANTQVYYEVSGQK